MSGSTAMLPARSRTARGAPDALDGRRLNLRREFAGGAHEILAADGALHQLCAVVGGPAGGRGGEAQPRAKMQRNGDARRDLRPFDGRRRFQLGIGAVIRARVSIEAEIERPALPGLLLHRAETHLGRLAQLDNVARLAAQKVAVLLCRKIEAVAAKIVGQKARAHQFRRRGARIGGGKGQAERQRAQLVDVGHGAPAVRQC